MIEHNSLTYAELMTFLRRVVGSKIQIFNEDMLKTSPSQREYITFSVGNFLSTGQIYKKKEETAGNITTGSVSEYKCQLYINVIGSPEFVNKNMGLISGAIQTFGFLEQYINDLYVENETMRMSLYDVKEDGVLYKFGTIVVDSYIALEYKNTVDWFDSIEDYTIEIKEV